MANNFNTSVNINGNINGLGVTAAGGLSLTPIGSTIFSEAMPITTGSYQLVLTGSNFGTASVFYVENTSTTSSINVAVSSSGGVSALGTLPVATANNSSATLINWNQLFAGIYAVANQSASNCVFVVASQ